MPAPMTRLPCFDWCCGSCEGRDFVSAPGRRQARQPIVERLRRVPANPRHRVSTDVERARATCAAETGIEPEGRGAECAESRAPEDRTWREPSARELSAGGGNRTRTPLSRPRILSPVRLP